MLKSNSEIMIHSNYVSSESYTGKNTGETTRRLSLDNT